MCHTWSKVRNYSRSLLLYILGLYIYVFDTNARPAVSDLLAKIVGYPEQQPSFPIFLFRFRSTHAEQASYAVLFHLLSAVLGGGEIRVQGSFARSLVSSNHLFPSAAGVKFH